MRINRRTGSFRNGERRGDRRGFTLMELIIAMTLTSVVVASVLSLLITQSRFVDDLSTSVELIEQVRSSSDLMGTEFADIV